MLDIDDILARGDPAVVVPSRSSGVVQYHFFGQTFLYAARYSTACSLNTSAELIWELCDDAKSILDIARSLERQLVAGDRGVRLDLLRDVWNTVVSFHRLGMLELRWLAELTPDEREGRYAADNGFSSLAEMDRAHGSLLRVAAGLLTGRAGAVIDLGCGNGALLRKICAAHPGILPFGVESNRDRFEHARRLLPRFCENFTLGNLLNNERPWSDGRRYRLAILMPGRLVEVDPAKNAALKERLRLWCDDVLVYAYGDWLERYTGLTELVERAGLPTVTSQLCEQGIQAGILSWSRTW
jgi:hypothetical protein